MAGAQQGNGGLSPPKWRSGFSTWSSQRGDMAKCPPSGSKFVFHYSSALQNFRHDMESVHVFKANFLAYHLFRMKAIEYTDKFLMTTTDLVNISRSEVPVSEISDRCHLWMMLRPAQRQYRILNVRT